MSENLIKDPIGDGKLVELTYKVIDAKTDSVLTEVEFPIGYVHGVNEILAPQVTSERTSILMESDQGKNKTFIVTRVDDKSVTIDGNNPLCGREVIFKLTVVTVRDATEEEMEVGGPVGAEPDISDIVGADQSVKPVSG